LPGRADARENDLRRLLLRFELEAVDPTADFEAAARIYRRCRRTTAEAETAVLTAEVNSHAKPSPHTVTMATTRFTKSLSQPRTLTPRKPDSSIVTLTTHGVNHWAALADLVSSLPAS